MAKLTFETEIRAIQKVINSLTYGYKLNKLECSEEEIRKKIDVARNDIIRARCLLAEIEKHTV